MTTPRSAALLHPDLPYDMGPRARRAIADIPLQQIVQSTTATKYHGRRQVCEEAFGAHYDDLRRAAGHIKQHTLDHLDAYLAQFIDRATQNGVSVHVAPSAVDARRICLDIARARGAKLCVKSKSMVTEEIQLLAALQAAGVETVETDLGEFIVQLDDDAPAHIVTPVIHKNRRSVARTFQRELGADYTEDARELTAIARRYLRAKFQQADLGVTGANFLVADSGSIVLCTNEGNGGLSSGVPDVLVIVAGIEKVIPSRAHLPVLLKLLARSATAQPLTVYTTLINGPRRTDEADGPQQVHLVLVDNGRSTLLEAETRELLRCIRCGACLNACPVFGAVGGGHAYGAVYSGPIGAAIMPLLQGVHNYADLPQASSLCGACREACPVDIDIPTQLVHLRRRQVDQGVVGPGARLAYRLWALCLRHPGLYRAAMWSQRLLLQACATERDDSGANAGHAWLTRLPGALAGWTAERDFPAPAQQSFRQWWRRRARESADG